MLNAYAVGDLHVKFVNGVNKDWQQRRYNMFIDDIVERCVKDSAILILAGDTIDSTNPKKEEVQTLLSLFHRLSSENITTLVVSGNHETLKVGSSILDYLELDKFTNVYYRRNYETSGCVFHLVNHDSLSSYRLGPLADTINILVSHFRCNYNQFVTEEIDVASFTKGYDLCVVGDIHDSFEFDNVVYTNNPVNKEFEGTPNNGFLKLAIDNGKISYERVVTDYPSLRYRKVTAEKYQTLRNNSSDDFYLLEVEGTPEELRSVLPKLRNVILKRVPIVPAALADVKSEEVVQTSSSAEDGLLGYLKILNYSDARVAELMNELRRAA